MRPIVFQSPSHRGTFSNQTLVVWGTEMLNSFNPLHIGALSRMFRLHRRNPDRDSFNPLHIGALSRIEQRDGGKRPAASFQSPSHRGTFSNKYLPRNFSSRQKHWSFNPLHIGALSRMDSIQMKSRQPQRQVSIPFTSGHFLE